MNQPSTEKDRLSRPRNRSRIFLAWLIFFAIALTLVVIIHVSTQPKPVLWAEVVSVLVLSLLFLGLWGFVRWCSCWRNFRRVLLCAAILATLAAIFYTEEYWRGKQAWQSYRRELEAKGDILDWEKLVPAPVPDDLNFFMASTNIRTRFIKASFANQAALTNSTWLNPSYKDLPVQRFSRTNAPVIAELIVTPSSKAPTSSSGLSVRLDDANRSEKIQSLVKSTLGRGAIGATGYHFSEYDISRLQPAHILLLADTAPSANDLASLIPLDLATNIGQLKLEATIDPKIFQVKLVSGSITPAAQYLAWTTQLDPAFDEVREALKRPYAQLPGDYSEPYLIPIPNFVLMRMFAQLLAQRVQCHILLGEPGKALPDLTLMHDVCRILERRPTGKPMTLVEAMINVAITGLYTETIRDGLCNHSWDDADLATLQAQFKEINLQLYLNDAFRCEQSHLVRLGEHANFEKLLNGELFGYGPKNKPVWERIASHIPYAFMPQGWVFQNIKVAVAQDQRIIDTFDPANELVFPKKIEQANQAMASVVEHRTVFRLLASIAVPNFTKAFQTYAFNQTRANEAQIACALERYRLVHGDYPPALEALTPQFMEKIPFDLFGGEPLHYHPTADGKFLLYSIGWNETDNGGKPGTLSDPKIGDWVWLSPSK